MTEPRRVRVLIVDDSAFARKVIRETLAACPEIEVVGSARDGLDALEKVSRLAPDVMTLDLVMPHLDGLGVLAALPSNPPRVIVVSTAADESADVVAALQMGAVAFVQKPTAHATERLYEIGAELKEEVLRAARTRPFPPRSPPAARVRSISASHLKMVVIGASTGGPHALTQIFAALPAGLPVPIAVVLHIPTGYTEAFAKRLDETSPLSICEAHAGLVMRPGTATVARAGMHLVIERRGDASVALLEFLPASTPHRPSIDVLFTSAAEAFGADVLGVVLTGMGTDGLEGARSICRAGGRVLTQSESSCVVYGMPRAVDDAGLSTMSVPMSEMAAAIVDHL